ncbi:MAG TPA: GNAT family N-acetyltransferase, partial [Casimicrobiaceae bacterium]|nr:GNAT family N-acetyltransferase [Casimicrobiaceae bacterium]
NLPGAYVPPHGFILLAGSAEQPLGCAALRPLDLERAGATSAEMKRLYVRASARGTGLGRALAIAVLDGARRLGYSQVKLDTLAQMSSARALYRDLGFHECDAYYHNPLGGTMYMAVSL